ncbi:signal peptidase II [Halocynthiibacter sp.]|uniref:signal peptidase II n=1 Tax=Halocynthiibacter sp. TaxID=1979210 RepID=UPI003C63F826
MKRMFTAGFLTLLLDQLSKQYVVEWLNLKTLGVMEVFPPYLNFHMAYNTGINFGLLSTSRWLLIALALVISAWVAWWVRSEGDKRWMQISGGILIGGALGNVIDRVIYGAVLDFLNMSCCGWENPYSFNVADIAIFIGAFGLILFSGEKKTA